MALDHVVIVPLSIMKSPNFFSGLFFLFFTPFLFPVLLQAISDKEPIVYGHYRQITSEILGEDRTILVYLPADYEISEKKYPILYQLNGDKGIFYKSASVLWYLEKMAEKMPGCILVGIPHPDRGSDLIGNRDNFQHFILEELVTFMEEQYRVSDYRMVCGLSTSALFVFDTFLKAPAKFDVWFLHSIGHSEGEITKIRAAISESEKLKELQNTHLFFTNTEDDPYDPTGERTRNCWEIVELLKKHLPVTNKVHYKIYQNESHVPFPSLYDDLRILYTP